ncbi:MAG: hypothetical protein QOF69_959 [Solirubrobacteraceae bacterium]|jgi:hypothetical protein|nr:hypothetical protein [Solirubrobacteraceae bacterium]MEA2181774.1 hypothetical protein [Solirubrobacteraceae bacterium]
MNDGPTANITSRPTQVNAEREGTGISESVNP